MTTDIAETIARVKRYAEVHRAQDVVTIPQADLAKVLSAAEAGIAAPVPATREAMQRVMDIADRREASIRDAALEEAAKVAEAVDPEKPANWLHPRHKIAFAIRALRSKP